MSHVFRMAMTDVLTSPVVVPRGQQTREFTAATLEFETDHDVWCTFPGRKLSIGYVCAEFLWYLRADPDDTTIADRAKIWRDLLSQGPIQSNYGVYLFREGQFHRCFLELARDPDSRRASVIILRPSHYGGHSADIPCTYALNFRVRGGLLEMSVHMRSNDLWFGAGNDVPIFRWTQAMLASLLGVPCGRYMHHVDSLHLYERHWGSARACITQEAALVVHPPIEHADRMIEDPLTPRSAFHQWLLENANA